MRDSIFWTRHLNCFNMDFLKTGCKTIQDPFSWYGTMTSRGSPLPMVISHSTEILLCGRKKNFFLSWELGLCKSGTHERRVTAALRPICHLISKLWQWRKYFQGLIFFSECFNHSYAESLREVFICSKLCLRAILFFFIVL